jgi:hypothetical protein
MVGAVKALLSLNNPLSKTTGRERRRYGGVTCIDGRPLSRLRAAGIS